MILLYSSYHITHNQLFVMHACRQLGKVIIILCLTSNKNVQKPPSLNLFVALLYSSLGVSTAGCTWQSTEIWEGIIKMLSSFS